MQTSIKYSNGKRYQLAFDDYDGMLYEWGRPRGPVEYQPLCKAMPDQRTLNGAWQDYLNNKCLVHCDQGHA